MALVVAPLTTAVMNAAPDALAGAASGVNNAASRLAGLFAVALVGAVAALVFARRRPAGGAVRRLPAGRRPGLRGRRRRLRPRLCAPGMATAAALAALAGAGGLATLGPARVGFFAEPPLDGGRGFANLCEC